MDEIHRAPPGAEPAARAERFELLFRAHSRALLGYGLRRLERPEDAADALSEVMLVAWRRLDEVPEGEQARLWLFGVARGVVANQRRSARRRTRLGERLRDEVGGAVARDHADAHEARATVRDALRRLPADDREILLLTAWEGLEPRELAAVMGLRRATARTRLHRARHRLRRELEALGASGERSAGDGHVGGDEQVLVPCAKEES